MVLRCAEQPHVERLSEVLHQVRYEPVSGYNAGRRLLQGHDNIELATDAGNAVDGREPARDAVERLALQAKFFHRLATGERISSLGRERFNPRLQ